MLSKPVTGRNQFLVWSNPGVNVMPGLPVLLAFPNGSRLNVWLQIVPQLALFEKLGNVPSVPVFPRVSPGRGRS